MKIYPRVHFPFLFAALFFYSICFSTNRSQAQSSSIADSSGYVKSSWVVLPSLFYTPKTGIGGGGAVRYFPKRHASVRPSSISASAVYTAKKQLILSLVPDIFFDGGKKRVFASILFLDFPDLFYGVGNDAPLTDSETYTARTASFLVSGEQEVLPRFSLGLQGWLRYESVREPESPDTSPGVLFAGELPGSKKGTAVGLGTFFRWDTRNNYFYTSNGTYVRGAVMFFGDAFGGDYKFRRYSLDIRKYFPIGWRHVIALRSYTRAVDGVTPFQLLPQIGGRELMRGYPEGRYRDNVMQTLQAEYRLLVYGPIGFVTFVSVGDLQPRFSDLGSEKLIFAAGPGLRFLINEEGLNFRIDYGIGRDGGSFYFTLGEAF